MSPKAAGPYSLIQFYDGTAFQLNAVFSLCRTGLLFLFSTVCGKLKRMQKIVTAEEMREIDRLTSERYGIPQLLLMENAAHAAARIIVEKLEGSADGKSVLILCGKGNNGGDGAALGRVLWQLGADVEVCLFGLVEDTKDEAHVNFDILQR